MEGPYLASEDGPRGAHPLEHVRDPEWEEFQQFQEAAGGLIKLLTLAPEREGAIPFIEIRPPKSYASLDRAIRQLASYDWLILTSENGVEAFFNRLRRVRMHIPKLMKIAAIGPATRAAIESHGRRVQVTPKEYVAEAVVRSLRAKVKDKRVLLVRAKVARDVIPQHLQKAGARVDVVAAYETVLPKSSGKRLRATLSAKARATGTIAAAKRLRQNRGRRFRASHPAAIEATISETAMTVSIGRKISHADGGSVCNAFHVVQLPSPFSPGFLLASVTGG